MRTANNGNKVMILREQFSCWLSLCIFILIFFLNTEAVASDDDLNFEQWKAVAQLAGIPSMPEIDTPSIYVFFDPNCPASEKLFRKNAGGKSFADAPVIWIPVYYMAADSLGKSAAMLRSGQFSAIRNNFTLYDKQKRLGAIEPVSPDMNEKQKLVKAVQVWTDITNTPATPMIVYKDKFGAAHVHLGYNPTEELEGIVKDAPDPRIKEYK